MALIATSSPNGADTSAMMERAVNTWETDKPSLFVQNTAAVIIIAGVMRVTKLSVVIISLIRVSHVLSHLEVCNWVLGVVSDRVVRKAKDK